MKPWSDGSSPLSTGILYCTRSCRTPVGCPRAPHILDVLQTFGLVVAYPLGPTAGFLFDFHPGVDVVLEEASREMSGRTNDGEVIWGKK